MISTYRTECFVFKKEDRLEADRIFSVFTKDFGKIKIFGISIRKIASKLRGGIELFSFSEIEFVQGKNKKTLTDTTSIKRLKDIFLIPEKLEIAYKVSDVLDRLIKGEEKDDNIFNLINDLFIKLNNYFSPANNYSLIYYYFFWNFINILGHSPELSKCVSCQQKLNPNNLCFSNREGGVICQSCFSDKKEAIAINSNTIKILRLILKKDWDILLKLKVESSLYKELEIISDNYYKYLANHYALPYDKSERLLI